MTEATPEDSEIQETATAKAADRRAMLTGAIVPTLMRLALPTIAVLVAQTMVGIAETYYAGLLGTDALVGTSVVLPIWMLMTMTSAGGIGSGVASAVARAIGAGRMQDADDLVLHAVALAITFGLALSAASCVVNTETIKFSTFYAREHIHRRGKSTTARSRPSSRPL